MNTYYSTKSDVGRMPYGLLLLDHDHAKSFMHVQNADGCYRLYSLLDGDNLGHQSATEFGNYVQTIGWVKISACQYKRFLRTGSKQE